MTNERFLGPGYLDFVALAPRDAALSLVHQPSNLMVLGSELRDQQLQARVEGNSQLLARVGQQLNTLNSKLETIDWTDAKTTQELNASDWQVLLTEVRSENREQKNLAEKLLHGYLEKRFYNERGEKQPANWRGSLNALHNCLGAALESDDPLPLLRTWMEIVTGKHPKILEPGSQKKPTGSLAWRSIALGTRAAHPDDYPVQKQAYEMTFILSYLSRMFQEYPAFKENSVRYNPYVSAIESAIFYSTPSIRLPPESLEFIQQVTENQRVVQRYLLSNRQIQDDYQQATADSPTRVWSRDMAKEKRYPDSLLTEEYPLVRQIKELYGPPIQIAKLQDELREMLGKKAAQYHFCSLAMQGLNGLVATPENLSALPPDERTRRLKELIDTHRISQPPTHIQDSPVVTALTVNHLSHPNPALYLLLQEPLLKSGSELESILDYTVDPDLRLEILTRVLPQLLDLRRSTRKVTRIPTIGGDYYDLRTMKGQELGQIFEAAVIHVDPERGPVFEVRLADPLQLAAHPESTVLRGTFQQEVLTKVVFDPGTPDLPTDLSFVAQEAILRLFERSFCPPLAEVQAEVDQINRENVEGKRPLCSIPGRIVHVGLRGPTQGTFTQTAELNYREAFATLNSDTHLSLAAINEMHRTDGNSDPRYLTYRVGFNAEGDNQPRLRANPEFLIEPKAATSIE